MLAQNPTAHIASVAAQWGLLVLGLYMCAIHAVGPHETNCPNVAPYHKDVL